jgi:hypothetical protein
MREPGDLEHSQGYPDIFVRTKIPNMTEVEESRDFEKKTLY